MAQTITARRILRSAGRAAFARASSSHCGAQTAVGDTLKGVARIGKSYKRSVGLPNSSSAPLPPYASTAAFSSTAGAPTRKDGVPAPSVTAGSRTSATPYDPDQYNLAAPMGILNGVLMSLGIWALLLIVLYTLSPR